MIRNVFRHCQMSPREKNHSHLRTTVLNNSPKISVTLQRVTSSEPHNLRKADPSIAQHEALLFHVPKGALPSVRSTYDSNEQLGLELTIHNNFEHLRSFAGPRRRNTLRVTSEDRLKTHSSCHCEAPHSVSAPLLMLFDF